MKPLSRHITESFVNEAKSKTLSGLEFKYMGNVHIIDYVDGDFVKTSKGKEFRISTLEKNGVIMPVKEPTKRTAWNKGDKIMSKTEYQKLCKDAAKTGGGENAYDMAQSMFLNQEIYARLCKDYPQRNNGWLKQQLQWDIEAYS